MAVRALVLTGFGINCDHETADAFTRAGAVAERVHLNHLVAAPERFEAFHILAIPGGFSFGDDVASGRILANRLRYKLGGPLQAFIASGKLAIGICNGFQVMVKLGMLPYFDGAFSQEVTLAGNDSNRYEDRWVHLAVNAASPCVWTRGLEAIETPVRHGEGKFIPRDAATLARLEAQGQVVVRYATADRAPAGGVYPINPNGAIGDIAGICDPSGRLFGLMPHPEAYLDRTNHPQWTRKALPAEGSGLRLFRNAVAYARERLV